MNLFPIRAFRVVEHHEETPEIFTLVIEPADGEPLFAFKSGQFVMVHLKNPDGSLWAKAAYSIMDAPAEAAGKIRLGIKIAGDFTKRLSALTVGDALEIQGPYGMFTLRDEGEPLFFFAGGIGVTPLIPMIREELTRSNARRMALFYSAKSVEEMAYVESLRVLASSHPQFQFVPTITRDVPDGWTGEQGRVTAEMIVKYADCSSSARAYMCGPTPFMDAIKEILMACGLDVATRLHKETF